jgi:hypothetical protein
VRSRNVGERKAFIREVSCLKGSGDKRGPYSVPSVATSWTKVVTVTGSEEPPE